MTWLGRLSAVAPLFLYCCGLLWWSTPAHPSDASAYPHSIEEEIKSLVAAGLHLSSDPVFLTRLAELYLDAGDDLYTKKRQRRQAYQEGARIARRVIELQEGNADAHYLYAANVGSEARLKGILASALVIRTLKKHTSRALELAPDHASALHMMGMLLEELPGLLGGDTEEALVYLQRAVEATPTYTHARLNLAKGYLKRKRFRNAKIELRIILETRHPRNPYTWARRHKPEAQRLLKSLEETGP